MGAQQRVYRQRIKSTQGMKKIFKAMELIAASRIMKARSRVEETTPYAIAITRACSALVAHSKNLQHELLNERDDTQKVAVVVFTSDRGQAGAYSSSVLRRSEQLLTHLKAEGKDPVLYVIGRKGISYFRFRNRTIIDSWEGFTDSPTFENATDIAEELVGAFKAAPDDGGVSEIFLCYTRFLTMVKQEAQTTRLLPLEVVEGVEEIEMDGALPLYEFEPGPSEVFDELIPRYIESRLYNALLQASASELAARQRAMKSAGDNANDLIKKYTRLANTARQAEITQEISEIVGGVDALADSGSGRR